MKTERKIINESRNVVLTSYLQEVGGEFANISKRPGIVILPGGGYRYCSTREMDPVAFAYLKAGYQVFILCYSTGEHSEWPTPLNDYDEAMEYIKSNAENFALDKDRIAVVGFSAGGHLAAAAATLANHRPAAAVLGYAPVLKEFIDAYLDGNGPDIISAVDENTCPCFIFSSRADNIVPIINSIKFMEALSGADVTFESHIYAYGPHGFSTADASVQEKGTPLAVRTPNWVNDSIGFLRDVMGEFGHGVIDNPVCEPTVSGNHDKVLSTRCTVKYLMSYPEARAIVQPIIDTLKKVYPIPAMAAVAEALTANMHLAEVMAYLSATPEMIQTADAQLAQIEK